MDVAIPAQTIYSLSSGIRGLDESVRLAAMGSEGDGVIYAVAVVASCTGEAKT